jgi:hypothetical protein
VRDTAGVFERFTDQARRCVVLAQEEARLLNHGYIGSEHALLGVLAEAQGIGAQALRSLDVSVDAVRAKVVTLVGRGDRPALGHIPFTAQAKRALEGALREALHAGDHEIGTEHLLLGLIRDGESTAARVLTELRVDLDGVRERVSDLRAGRAAADPHLVMQSAVGPVPGTSFGRPGGNCSFCGRDVWETEHYVAGDGAVICDVCTALAHDAIRTAEPGTRPVRLPARVFGEPPDDDAVSDIAAVVELVLMSGAAGDDKRAAGLEDGERLAPLSVDARRRHGNVAIENRLDRIGFVNADEAEVRIAIGIVGGPGTIFEGRVRRIDGAWKVSRELFCATMRAAGMECPPPREG